ncbi:MAG: protein kinase [Myxococcaceae bacterium]
MLTAGASVGRYVIKRKLAEGGMAEIFLASAVGPEGFAKDVVIKVVRSFLATDSQFVQMFIAEARLASKLNHANIVQIFDFGKHGDSYYLAMEFVRGASLWDLRRKCRELKVPFPPTLAAEIGAQIARGMHYAHTLVENGQKIGVVHRDVTPHNVLLSFDGAVKLTDFGIAKATTSQTAPGMLKGKFAYMSPEQSRGDKVDARTDLFALGIVLWELLTGGKLFEGDSDLAVLRAVQESLIAPPSRINPEVPRELSDVVMKALARPLDERFQSAFELERALANFVLRNAKSVEDTSVAQFLQQMFREEFERPSGELPPIPDDTLPPGAHSGMSGTVPRVRTITATPVDPPRPTVKTRRGVMDDDDDAPPAKTDEFNAGDAPPKPKTEQMPALARPGRPPSRKFDPLPVASEPSVLVRPSLQTLPTASQTESQAEPEMLGPSSHSVVTSPEREALPPAAKRSSSALYVVLGILGVGLVIGVLAVAFNKPAVAVEPPPTEPVAVNEPVKEPVKEPDPPAVAEPVAVVKPEEPAPVEPKVEAKPEPAAVAAKTEPKADPPPVADPKPAAPAVKRMGTLAIKAVPFATVLVQGKTYEVQGIRNVPAPAGTYEITLKHPRKTSKEKVSVQANQVTSVSFSAE